MTLFLLSIVSDVPHQSTSVLPVDSVTGDGHEMALGCHDVTQ